MADKTEAFSILKEILRDDTSINFPLDPLFLAQYFNTQVFEAKLPGTTKTIVVHEVNRNPEIFLNKNLRRVEKRVACINALKHIIKNRDNTERYGYIINDIPEAYDDFTLELLMPGFAVREQWGKGYSLKKMARIFDVTVEMLEYRITGLKLY